MTTARKTFRAAFWETEDWSGRSALIGEYETLEEAEAEVARQLSRSNSRVAALYVWDDQGHSWRELGIFNSDGIPFHVH